MATRNSRATKALVSAVRAHNAKVIPTGAQIERWTQTEMGPDVKEPLDPRVIDYYRELPNELGRGKSATGALVRMVFRGHDDIMEQTPGKTAVVADFEKLLGVESARTGTGTGVADIGRMIAATSTNPLGREIRGTAQRLSLPEYRARELPGKREQTNEIARELATHELSLANGETLEAERLDSLTEIIGTDVRNSIESAVPGSISDDDYSTVVTDASEALAGMSARRILRTLRSDGTRLGDLRLAGRVVYTMLSLTTPYAPVKADQAKLINTSMIVGLELWSTLPPSVWAELADNAELIQAKRGNTEFPIGLVR